VLFQMVGTVVKSQVCHGDTVEKQGCSDYTDLVRNGMPTQGGQEGFLGRIVLLCLVSAFKGRVWWHWQVLTTLGEGGIQ
jgi:hypothetical protein